MVYKYLEKILPYELEIMIYSFIWIDKKSIQNNFQRSLFCIDFYGIQKMLGRNIFLNGKIISITNYGKGIYEYIKEELTQKNRKDTINFIKRINNLDR